MSDVKITREVYKQYAHKIASVLENEEFYEQFRKRVDSGASTFKLGKKRLIQDISIDWIDTIEEILPNLDTIVRNPRRFIVQEEDIVDVSLARSISTESVKFLAQHTNMISKVEDDGSVIPSKILNITKEESFEIYENRFIYTLLLKLKDFVTMRYDKIKKASATQDVLELDVESRFNLPSKKITFRTEYFAQLSFDEVMRLDPDTLTKIERVAKIDRIITDFLSSSFAKSMRNSAPVRPPIMRTNVILKEPNFKKALVLWQFIETYNQTAGFSTTDDVEDLQLESESINNLRSMVTLNTMLFESMYEEYETNMDMEDKQFGDFLRVGEMDFEKDQIDRDEYAQKLEEKKEDEEEQDNIEEVKPEEEPKAEHEIPPEEQPEEQKEEEQKEEPIEEKETERPVEIERFKEMPPKADQEEVDLEPDAAKFDQHLFEVRKLYKRPDDDKLKQEDIAKVRDAIDRCLTSYRRIKQEELDELERDDRIRRRKKDIEKRAVAFSKQRLDLSNSAETEQSTDIYFGMDPLSYLKAKLAAERLEQERQEQLKLNKDENLELEGDREAIAKEIDEMEAERAAREAEFEQAEQAEQTVETPEQPQEEPVSEFAAPDDLPEKRGLRLAKDEGEIDPWAVTKQEDKPVKEFTPVDEGKVSVGDIHFADGTDTGNPFGELSGITSNRAEVRKEPEQPDASEQQENTKKPKRRRYRRRKAKAEQAAEQPLEQQPAEQQPVETPAPQQDEATEPDKAKRTPPTPVDESKVAVGGIRFADGTNIDDPFGGMYGLTSNRAETRRPDEQPEAPAEQTSEQEDKPAKRKRRRRKSRRNEDIAEANDARPETEPEAHEDIEQSDAQNSQTEQPNIAEEAVPDEELQGKEEQLDEPSNENADVVSPSDDQTDEGAKAEENGGESEAVGQDDGGESAPAKDQDESEAPVEGNIADETSAESGGEEHASPEDRSVASDSEQIVGEKPAKRGRKRKDKGELSPTTVNQKYSQPTGRKLNLSSVDESKVGVGGITFKDGSGVFDPFGSGIGGGLGNNAERPNDSDGK